MTFEPQSGGTPVSRTLPASPAALILFKGATIADPTVWESGFDCAAGDGGVSNDPLAFIETASPPALLSPSTSAPRTTSSASARCGVRRYPSTRRHGTTASAVRSWLICSSAPRITCSPAAARDPFGAGRSASAAAALAKKELRAEKAEAELMAMLDEECFVPKGTERFGQHGSDRCFCEAMYGTSEVPWGCKWFELVSSLWPPMRVRAIFTHNIPQSYAFGRT